MDTITNSEYQERLNEKYNGTVTAVERFLNWQAILLHHCSECQRDFFARPLWLLNKDSQRHICHQGYGHLEVEKRGIYKTRVPKETQEKIIELYKSGWSYKRIGTHFGISNTTARYYVRKEKDKAGL